MYCLCRSTHCIFFLNSLVLYIYFNWRYVEGKVVVCLRHEKNQFGVNIYFPILFDRPAKKVDLWHQHLAWT